jgi:hypothetical protein
MAGAVKPIQEGFHSITPYLTVRSVADAITILFKKLKGC